jgi:ferredoxin
MKKILMFYFSGTGMTKYLLIKLQQALYKLDIQLELVAVELANLDNTNWESYQQVALAYSVHGFNAPQLMVEFAKKLPALEHKPAFILASAAGGDMKANLAASHLLTKELKSKGYQLYLDQKIIMPSNFVAKAPEDLLAKILRDLEPTLASLASAISNQTNHLPSYGLGLAMFAKVMRMEWHGARVMGKSFRVTPKCTRCTTCVKHCPVQNVSLQSETIVFGKKCQLCMRCLYGCPQRAIEPRWPYKFITVDSWYDFLDHN